MGRDNTVKYNWRILQLLPDAERTSYAGLRVEVLERPDGQLIVRYDGRLSRGHPGTTAAHGRPVGGRHRLVSGSETPTRGQQRGGSPHQQVAIAPSDRPGTGASGRRHSPKKNDAAKDAASKTSNPWTRTPTPTQLARWKAIQKGRLKGLSLRAISRELGISRVTVRKYAYAEKPPTKKLSAKERAKLMALRKSRTDAN